MVNKRRILNYYTRKCNPATPNTLRQYTIFYHLEAKLCFKIELNIYVTGIYLLLADGEELEVVKV